MCACVRVCLWYYDLMYLCNIVTYYHIMQIVCGGKLLQLQNLVEIHVKTFVVVSFMQYFID